MSEEEKEVVIEDAEAVLAGEPTIRERLDKLEKMMEQILLRMPIYTATSYSAPVWATSSSVPYTVTTTGSTTTNIVYNSNQ